MYEYLRNIQISTDNNAFIQPLSLEMTFGLKTTIVAAVTVVVEECRICMEMDDSIVMLSPCKCKGTQKYVHAICLNKWRSSSYTRSHSCSTCGTLYPPHIKSSPLLSTIKDVVTFLFNLFEFVVVCLYVLGTNGKLSF